MPRWAGDGPGGAGTPGEAFRLDAVMGVVRRLEGHGRRLAGPPSAAHARAGLTGDEVVAGPNGGVTLWPATLALVLPLAVATGFRRFAAEDRLMFPG